MRFTTQKKGRMWHVIDLATGKTVAFRQNFRVAAQTVVDLENKHVKLQAQ